MKLALLTLLLTATPLTADEAVARAVKKNPALAEVAAAAEAAAASLRAAEDARTPRATLGASGGREERLSAAGGRLVETAEGVLGADAGVTWSSPIGTSLGLSTSFTRRLPLVPDGARSDAWDAGLQARQALLRGGGARAVLAAERAAAARRLAAEAALREELSSLVRDVRLAHRALAIAEAAVQIAEEAERLAAKQRDDAEQKERALGTIPHVEVLRFVSEHAQVRRALEAARRERAVAAIELARLIGAPADADGLAAPWAPAVVPASLEGAPLLSPALAAAEAERDAAAERLVQAEDAARVKLDLTGSAGLATLSSPALSDALVGEPPAWRALLGLELELPLGGAREHAEEEGAAAELRAAEARVRMREEALRASWLSARAELAASRAEVSLAREEATAAAQLAEAERARLQLGTSVATELLAAQQAERAAALAALRAEAAYEAAALRLSHLTGAWVVTLAGGGT